MTMSDRENTATTRRRDDPNAPDSPCVGICTTLYDDVCRGCGRTAMEVATWVTLEPEVKDEAWERIERQGFGRSRSKPRG